MSMRWTSALFLGMTVLAAPAIAEVPLSARTLVTDPAVLESMGFPRDAQNVYIANGVGRNDIVPEDFGSRDTYTAVPAKAFMARESPTGSTAYNGGTEGCCGNLTRLASSDTFWDAPLDFPSGALLKEFRLYAVDTDATLDVPMFVFERCQPEAGGVTSSTTIATATTTGSAGGQAPIGVVAPNVTVNNRTCSYMVRVNLLGTSTHTLQKIRARWSRQVSPAPGVATFTDVPTSHFAFRFVEALVASGVTGGCGAGVYCPDAPLTRAQMAIFLATALGLSFE